ncbi:hypothetical protein CK203_084807 [Vitis vinifera]|uniref:Retrovirus-related Pol polyprotein from transposon RE1 n=1 Tax=Vitis vinifera TaxID=29760 RepID=A0A438BVQ2_VITVI|nr:hypothetical protein CK203_084807 [Vitis vinifera]
MLIYSPPKDRPSFIPAKSLWPSLIPVNSPYSQSQGRKRFLIGRIVVRKHSPPTTFPVNFSGELSRRTFLHRKDRLEEISNFSQSTGARKPSMRRPRAFFRSATASHAPAREGAPARASFGVLLLPRALRSVFPASSGYFFSTPIPARALGSVLLPFRSMKKYGMASSQVSSVTSPESGGRSEIPNLGGSDSSPILITGHKLNGHNYLQWLQSMLLFICSKGKDEYLIGEAAMPETTKPGFRKWKIENNMIMSWLINSMNNDIEQPAPTLDASALAARSFNSSGGDRQKRDRPWCDYCKKPGHYKEACWKLYGKPADWKPKPRSDRDGRAHVAANSASTSVPEPSPFNKEQMEKLQKLLSQVGSGSTTRIAFIANRGGMKSWIVDTGASDHMTGDAAILQNYKPSNGHSSVHIADGSKSKIAGTVLNCVPGSTSSHVANSQTKSLKQVAYSLRPLLIYHSKYLVAWHSFKCILKIVANLLLEPISAFSLGYSPTQKGYKCYSPTNKRFYTTIDVSFFEHVFFYPKSHVQGESMNEHQVWESLLEGVPSFHSESPNPSQFAPTELSTPMPSLV